jgi:TPP-dependent trihydroxycyclohexane-1,2-dione (THcHDO) dehydratase
MGVNGGTGGGAASAALTRLTDLRRDAATAYATISDADAALHALAGQRVAGERVLRHALARHQAASRALAAHARAKPGRLTHLLSGFRAGREWLARQEDLNAAVREAAGPLTAARQTVSGVKREFAAQVHTRAEAVTALRRLTAECVTVLAEIGQRETGLAETGLDEIGRGDCGGANTACADQRLLPAAGLCGCHNECRA